MLGSIEGWICDWVAEFIHIDSSLIDVHRPIVDYGIDSIEAADLGSALEQWLGRPVHPSLVRESSTTREIAQSLTMS